MPVRAKTVATYASGVRICKKCGVEKALGDFRKAKHSVVVYKGTCKECESDSRLNRSHGAGAAEWKRKKLEEQGGVCAMCETKATKWHLDHDHATGKWRDVLCNTCNTTFGVIEKVADNPKMRDHLKKYGVEVSRIS